MMNEDARTVATVQVTLTPEYAVAALGGSLTQQYSQAIREQLRALVIGGQRYVLVDFAGATEIDSSGLSALVSLVKLARERGGAVRCCAVPPPVYALFELTHLDRLLDFYPSQEAALSQAWSPVVSTHG
jgi:anti-anti-sigma factor